MPKRVLHLSVKAIYLSLGRQGLYERLEVEALLRAAEFIREQDETVKRELRAADQTTTV